MKEVTLDSDIRAWAVFRDALLAMGYREDRLPQLPKEVDLKAHPGDNGWELLPTYLGDHKDQLSTNHPIPRATNRIRMRRDLNENWVFGL